MYRGIFFALILSAVLGFAQVSADRFSKQDLEGLPSGENLQVLIIGANGSVAKWVTSALLNTKVKLKLYLRNAKRLEYLQDKAEIIEGDALDKAALKKAMQNVDVIYANLYGRDTPKMAEAIIESMQEAGVKRLIWITAFGVYNDEYQEIPQSELARIAAYIEPHKEEVKVIESSSVDYTIIRAQWFSNIPEIDYELTKKGEAFRNPSARISRKSIAHLVTRLILTPDFGIRESFGINKP